MSGKSTPLSNHRKRGRACERVCRRLQRTSAVACTMGHPSVSHDLANHSPPGRFPGGEDPVRVLRTGSLETGVRWFLLVRGFLRLSTAAEGVPLVTRPFSANVRGES